MVLVWIRMWDVAVAFFWSPSHIVQLWCWLDLEWSWSRSATLRPRRADCVIVARCNQAKHGEAKRGTGQEGNKRNEALGRWATAICRSFQLRPKDDPFEETLLYLEDWTLRSLSSTSIHLYAVLAFFASIFSERLASFRMEIFAPWKASVTISEFEGHRRSPKATEGSRDKSGKSLRSKALQAPRPSGGGCNCKSLNFRRKYSYKRMLKHVETCWNTKEFKRLETQRQSQHWHIFASFQKRFMTAMSRTMSKQNAVGKVKGPRILKNTCKMSHVKEPRINLTWRWIVQHDTGCSLCNQWKDLLKCPQFDLSKL